MSKKKKCSNFLVEFFGKIFIIGKAQICNKISVFPFPKVYLWFINLKKKNIFFNYFNFTMVKICLTLGIKGKFFFSNYMSVPEQFYFDILHCDFHGTGEFCIKAWCTNYKEPVKSSNKSTNSGLSKNQTHRT